MQPMYRSLRKAVSCLVVLLLIFAISSSCSAATDTFTYDANGNMISGSGFSYEYNDANQLIQVINESDSSTVADYFYDSNGQRVKKIENGITTYYIGDYVETRVTGSTEETTSYYFANNERVARKDPDGLKYYYHGDHLGSTSVVSDENGALSEKVSYYPYGSLKERVGEGSTYLFTDQEFDDESGLYYYGERYYDPELTRFTQPDAIVQDVYNPQNLNRYSYVLNNPLKYVDPTGNCFIFFDFGSEKAKPIYWIKEYLKWMESNTKAFEEATGIKSEVIGDMIMIGSMNAPLGVPTGISKKYFYAMFTYSSIDFSKRLPAPRAVEGKDVGVTTTTTDEDFRTTTTTSTYLEQLRERRVKVIKGTSILFDVTQMIIRGPPSNVMEGLYATIEIEKLFEKANELQEPSKIGTATTTDEDIRTTTTTTTSSYPPYPPTGMRGGGF